MVRSPFTVWNAEVEIHHAWADGFPLRGPLGRHLAAPLVSRFRSGVSFSQVEPGARMGGSFGEWRAHGPGRAMASDWLVEMAGVLGDEWQDGERISQWLRPGTPLVVVVRYFCRESGAWRLFQFHDAELLPLAAGDDAGRMGMTVRVAAGWMEEFKSGEMPAMEPRIRGVIEWHHSGRVVRCWEYDPVADEWVEDAENSAQEGAARYVTMDDSDGVALGMMAAVTAEASMAGIAAAEIEWRSVGLVVIGESSGLTFFPGISMETPGCPEPVMMPPSGRHWEHPKMVFRVLGRVYATACAGVLVMPSFQEGAREGCLDVPIRLGRLVLYPDGGWLLPESE